MLTVLYILVLWFIYLALTNFGTLGNWALGLLVAVAVTMLLPSSTRSGSLNGGWRRLPGALWAAVTYIVVLLIDLLKSGIQVAGIVLTPGLPIAPGIVAIDSQCESAAARALSTHAITVTPGEMVVEVDEDGVMYTHCLDAARAAEYSDRAQRQRRELLQRIVT
jgi:multicomponent Na+:H+ antiporter subunit E